MKKRLLILDKIGFVLSLKTHNLFSENFCNFGLPAAKLMRFSERDGNWLQDLQFLPNSYVFMFRRDYFGQKVQLKCCIIT